MDILLFFNLLGTAAFAVSGVWSAFKHKIDIVGAIFVGSAAGLGGGIIRDVILGRPSLTFQNSIYLEIILISVLITFLMALKLHNYFFWMVVFDAVGLATFSLLTFAGLAELGLGLGPRLFLAVIAAVGGGVIRDILMNEIPLIFRKELYVTCALLGLLLYYILERISFLPQPANLALAGIIIVTIRIFSFKMGFHLPTKTINPAK